MTFVGLLQHSVGVLQSATENSPFCLRVLCYSKDTMLNRLCVLQNTLELVFRLYVNNSHMCLVHAGCAAKSLTDVTSV